MRRLILFLVGCGVILANLAFAQETDYKFWYILRADDGHILKAAVRFYEGTTSAALEADAITGQLQSVTRYRRTKRLVKTDLAYLGATGFTKDGSGSDVKVYTEADFGRMATDKELQAFLASEIVKDQTRTPIKEVTDVALGK